MEVERGDTGGRTRTVFVDTGMGPALADPETLAEALARFTQISLAGLFYSSVC